MVTIRPAEATLRALRVLRAVLVAAIPVVALLLLRSTPEPIQRAGGATSMQTEPAVVEERRGLDWYAPLWQRDLRQPPIPPAQPAPQRPAEGREPLPKLVTTFVERESRYAHFLDPQGKLRFCGLDERVGSFRVAAIEPGRARLVDGDFAVWIEMPKPERE